jgi:hypothetical protein
MGVCEMRVIILFFILFSSSFAGIEKEYEDAKSKLIKYKKELSSTQQEYRSLDVSDYRERRKKEVVLKRKISESKEDINYYTKKKKRIEREKADRSKIKTNDMWKLYTKSINLLVKHARDRARDGIHIPDDFFLDGISDPIKGKLVRGKAVYTVMPSDHYETDYCWALAEPVSYPKYKRPDVLEYKYHTARFDGCAYAQKMNAIYRLGEPVRKSDSSKIKKGLYFNNQNTDSKKTAKVFDIEGYVKKCSSGGHKMAVKIDPNEHYKDTKDFRREVFNPKYPGMGKEYFEIHGYCILEDWAILNAESFKEDD